jgi:hypothetical protein
VDDYYGIPERIKAVTKEQIVAVAGEFIASSHTGLGFLGTAPKELREQLQHLLHLDG